MVQVCKYAGPFGGPWNLPLPLQNALRTVRVVCN